MRREVRVCACVCVFSFSMRPRTATRRHEEVMCLVLWCVCVEGGVSGGGVALSVASAVSHAPQREGGESDDRAFFSVALLLCLSVCLFVCLFVVCC